MSSINPYFTFTYSQPEEYHFSHDSVFLARRAFEILKDLDLSQARGLDLCSGCGIIGLDFLFHCRAAGISTPSSFSFLEVQNIYREHFQKNREIAKMDEINIQFINKNYEELQSSQYHGVFDLILCNPPYFRLGQGKLSPSEFKNRCRFFIDSDFTDLLKSIASCLSKGGTAFMLLRDLAEHGISPLAEAQSILAPDFTIELLENIRGTGLVTIKHQAS